MTYEQAINYINSYTKSGKAVTDLSRFGFLAGLLGNPEKDLKFIHIAGTNGKGSVCEYMALAFQYSGYLTGKFTSPFILVSEERIQLNNKNIDKSDFARFCTPVKEAVEKAESLGVSGFSQFEVFFALALLYYKEKKADIVILETGIGGTLDCTNIVTPEVSVIISVDFDHCAILGDTLAQIASHKAGIIKENIPAVLSPIQDKEVFKVVQHRAASINAPLIIPDSAKTEFIKTSLFGTEFRYNGELFRTKMGGKHQMTNAVTAIEGLKLCGIEGAAVRRALENAVLPARMNVVSIHPLLVIDGAHNPSGIAAACELIKATEREYGGNFTVCAAVGMMNTKDRETALHILTGTVGEFIFTNGFSSDAVRAEELASIVDRLSDGKAAAVCEHSVATALKLALERKRSLTLVIGSLYLAGKAMTEAERLLSDGEPEK